MRIETSAAFLVAEIRNTQEFVDEGPVLARGFWHNKLWEVCEDKSVD